MSLISIIVPAYNAEKTIARCIDSLLGQTLSDIEIIIIDDGSTDTTGEICTHYSTKDPRVNHITIEHSGVSCARNIGLKSVKSNYVGFVDADDYVDANMYEQLFTEIKKYEADIAICGYSQADFDGNIKRTFAYTKDIINNENLIKASLKDIRAKNYITVAMWNKLYLSKLFENFKFEEHREFEDIIASYQIFKKASICTVMEYVGYVYCFNKNSICNKAFDKTYYDRIDMNLKRYYAIKEDFNNLKKFAKRRVWQSIFLAMYKIENLNEEKYDELSNLHDRYKEITICGSKLSVFELIAATMFKLKSKKVFNVVKKFFI